MIGMFSRAHARPAPLSVARASAAIALLLALLASVTVAAALPAFAADGALKIEKTVGELAESVALAPGDEFTYRIDVGCDDADCLNAEMTDTLPTEFEDFEIITHQVLPTNQPSEVTFAGGCSATGTVTDDCTLTVAFQQDLTGTDDVGIVAGDGFALLLTLKVPQDLPATWSGNGIAITNTASVSADNAPTVEDPADVVVTVPIEVDVEVTKDWTPSSSQFAPGNTSVITLGVGNDSNYWASSLTLQEPSVATDFSALSANNPFLITDFVSIDSIDFPEGADQVRIDAYEYHPGQAFYVWATGTGTSSSGPFTLPSGVLAENVAGLRFTFTSSTGETIEPDGEAASVEVTVAQRETDRSTGASLNATRTLTNIVSGTVAVTGENPVTKTAQDTHRITAITVRADVDKTITPARVPAGGTAAAVVQATNTSNAAVDTLTVSDKGFFDADVVFGGFTAGVDYPSGATAATLTWHTPAGDVAEPLADGATPVAPAASTVTGFTITFTGEIPQNAFTKLYFDIEPTTALVGDELVARGDSLLLTNTATAETKRGSTSANDTDPAPLTVFYPDIDIDLTKTLIPSGAVAPGTTVVGSIEATTSTDSAFVTPTEIVITDVWDTSAALDFWNGFNAYALAPTQVLAGTTLTVEYTTDAGGSWTVFDTYTATTSPVVVQDNFDSAYATSIDGLRFTYTNPAGYSQGAVVKPNIVFQARDLQRDGTGFTDDASDSSATVYSNTAIVVGTGTATGIPDPITSEPVEADDTAQIQRSTGSGDGGFLTKRWTNRNFGGNVTTLNSESGSEAGTVAEWGVTSTGLTEVYLTDWATADGNAPTGAGDTVFQAFDLIYIGSVTTGQDPLLKWDDVSKVELFNSTTNSWQTVSAPGGTWMNSSGAFKGYTLTTAQRATTIGVRLTIVPDDAARAASTDPTATPVGAGVSTSALDDGRPFRLRWALRNVERVIDDSSYPWVTSLQEFNVPGDSGIDPGIVRNTAGLQALHGTTGLTSLATASDDVILVDQSPAVSITKSSQRGEIFVPEPGDVDPGAYRTNTWTVTAANESSARASYIRVTDPLLCGAASACAVSVADVDDDPFDGATYSAATSMFEEFTLEDLTFTSLPSYVNQTQSTVTLWHWNPATNAYSTTTHSITEAIALGSADFADVIGLSVLYQGTDPEVNGGLIEDDDLTFVLHTRLRVTERSTGDYVDGASPEAAAGEREYVDNDAIAQTFDLVLEPAGPTESKVFAVAEDDLFLTEGFIDVTASKTISPSSLLEADRDDQVTVTLGATSGDAEIATHEVTISDADADFWNAFQLTGLGAVAKPAGAELVSVGVQLDGGTAWIDSTPATTAALPDLGGATLADVTGIRFVFTDQAGALLSSTAPPQAWSASAVLLVQLRDADRVAGEDFDFPSTYENTVVTISHRNEPGVADQDKKFPDATDEATDDIRLDPGTFQIDVAKDPAGGYHTVLAGDDNIWTLEFTNTGTGFLTIEDLVDTLPTSLEWDYDTPVYTTSSGGTLATTGITADYDSSTREITFAWPEGGQRMSPGETFTIELNLVLQPGLTPSQRATNEFVVTTAQVLAQCTNTSGNGQGLLSGLAETECGTSNYVQPIAGPALLTKKSVKGDVVDPLYGTSGQLVTGATSITSPPTACVADSEGYYRAPCAANTVVGAEDSWKLETVNSGTVGINSLVIVDALPAEGDRMLATGAARGSTFAPEFTGPDDVTIVGLPPGVTAVLEVTTVPQEQVCVGTGSGTAWNSDPTCSTHPSAASWTLASAYAGDWGDVTGLRWTIDYTTRTDAGNKNFRAGETLTVYYHSYNAPAETPTDTGAESGLFVSTEYAWNQHGVYGVVASGGTLRRAPVRAGVTLPTGPLEITKAVTGDGDEYAPESFTAQVQCTLPEGTPMDLDGDGYTEEDETLEVTLNAANSYTVRLDGIPLGTSCVVTETGDLGEFGESARSITPESVTILTAAGAAEEVPDGQSVAITNTYALTDLTVSKTVSTTATVGSFGPFEFTVTCESALGADIPLAAADASFTLVAGGSRTIEDLPIGAECTVTETGTDNADATTWELNDAPVDGAAPTVTLANAAVNTLEATNVYDGGTLTVTKTVAGDGGDDYGSGPFVIAVQCTYDGQTLFDDSLTVVGGAVVTLSDAGDQVIVFPAGTSCAVEETTTGGASEVTGESPAVLIEGPGDGETIGAVTADVTNTFNVGTLELLKEREGEGVDTYGAGPFVLQATCTWVKDGQTLTVPLPDAGVVTLNADNAYAAQLTGLIQGADCVVTETATGGANEVAYSPADPADETQARVTVGAEPVTVTVTNTFLTGALQIDKKRVGVGVDLFGGGPFTVTAQCTYLVDGVVTPVVLPTEGIYTLSAENDFTITIEDIPAGAECVVAETDAGLAVESWLTPADGVVTITPASELGGQAQVGETTVVTVTNRFAVGEVVMTKEADVTTAFVGDEITYTIAVTNTGEVTATDVEVVDLLPDGLGFVSASGNGVLTTVDGQPAVVWTADSLAPGQTLTFLVSTVVLDSGEITNVVRFVTPDGPWPLTPDVPSTVLSYNPLADTGVDSAATVGAGLLGAVFLLGGLVLAFTGRRRGAATVSVVGRHRE